VLPSGKNQTKWLFGPTVSIGLVFALKRENKSVAKKE